MPPTLGTPLLIVIGEDPDALGKLDVYDDENEEEEEEAVLYLIGDPTSNVPRTERVKNLDDVWWMYAPHVKSHKKDYS